MFPQNMHDEDADFGLNEEVQVATAPQPPTLAEWLSELSPQMKVALLAILLGFIILVLMVVQNSRLVNANISTIDQAQAQLFK